MKQKFLLFSLFLSSIYIICPLFAQDTHPIRVALFIDKGAHARPMLLDALANDQTIEAKTVFGEDIRNGCLKNFDVIFMPGGSGKKEAFSLGDGEDNIRQFVKGGGIYIGVCAGCYLATHARSQYLCLIPVDTRDKEHWHRGKAMLPIEFTKKGMEVFGANSPQANVIYHNGPVMKIDQGYEDQVIPLSYYRGEKVADGGKVGVMVNSPAMVLCNYGKGIVLGISPHPEATEGLTQLEPHAIHWLYNHQHGNKLEVSVTTKTNSSVATNAATNIEPAPKATSKTLSNRIYNKAEEIFENTISSHYQHLHEGAEEQVQEIDGKYHATTDCSGFVSYVINAVAPKHYYYICEMTKQTYPHAATYAQFFLNLNDKSPTNGWLRIANYKDLQRGDVIAWERKNLSEEHRKKHNTGHVMIVVDSPSKVIVDTSHGDPIKYVEVYVLDSSSVEHFPPQLLPLLAHQNHRDGIGKGVIRLVLDNQNNVVGYWEGTFSHEKEKQISGPSCSDTIGFARLISLLQ